MGQELQGDSKDFIQNLYGLRAGLSVLSQERDKITGLESKLQSKCIEIRADFKKKSGLYTVKQGGAYIKEAKPSVTMKTDSGYKMQNPYSSAKMIAECQSYYGSASRDLWKYKKDLSTYQESIKSMQDKIKQLKSNAELEQKNYTTGVTAIIGLVGIILLIMVGWLLFFLAIAVFFDELPQSLIDWLTPAEEFFSQGINPALFYLLTFAIEIGGIVAIVKLISYVYKTTKGHKGTADLQSDRDDNEEQVRDLEIRLRNKSEEIEKQQHKISQCEKIMARASWGINNASQYEAKFNAEIENTERKIYPIQVTCNKIYEALQREYGSILDERDWQYLDLVIFYYETGRAFTKQEALQQVDREVQTERIIDSIDRAAVYIGNTIRMGTYIISSQIEGLSRQLSNISLDIKELNVNVKSLNSSLEVAAGNQEKQIQALQQQNSELQSLVSAANLSNALQEKANTTSERLMTDVNYIRNYML